MPDRDEQLSPTGTSHSSQQLNKQTPQQLSPSQCHPHALLAERGVGEDGRGFGEEGREVVVTGRVMAEHKALYTCPTGDLGRLAGRGVEGLAGTRHVSLHERSLVVEAVHTLDEGHDGGQKLRVRTESVAAWRCGRTREPLVGHGDAVWSDIVGPLLDGPQRMDGHLVEVDHIAPNVRLGRAFGKEVAAGGDAVAEGDGPDADGAILHHERVLRGVDQVEAHLVGHVLAKDREDGPEEVFQGMRSMDDQLTRPAQHAERGE